MENAFAMCLSQANGDLAHELGNDALRPNFRRAHQIRQRWSADVRHADVQRAFVFADIVHMADVGMVQRSGGTCFAHTDTNVVHEMPVFAVQQVPVGLQLDSPVERL